MKISLGLLAIICLSLYGCEEILDSDGLPYEELLVINGVLYADSSSNFIQVSKTLPLNVPFDTNVAFLKDAVGEVTSNGRSYPLEYIGYGGQYRVVGLIPKQGDSYAISVRWRGLAAHAVTNIPTPTVVDSVWYSKEVFREATKVIMNMRLKGNNKLAIRAGFHINVFDTVDNGYSSIGTYYTLLRSLDNATLTDIDQFVPSTYRIESVTASIYTFSEGYYEYASTLRNNDLEEFGGEPVPVDWNVEGDGIGGFFGVTKKYY